MKKNQKPFNLESFLATVAEGRAVSTYREGDIVFSQGDRCDGVFYIRSGDCKISVISEQGKTQSSPCIGAGISLVKVVSPGSLFGSPPRRQ
jgi:CRP-like cAMP-binding protein